MPMKVKEGEAQIGLLMKVSTEFEKALMEACVREDRTLASLARMALRKYIKFQEPAVIRVRGRNQVIRPEPKAKVPRKRPVAQKTHKAPTIG